MLCHISILFLQRGHGGSHKSWKIKGLAIRTRPVECWDDGWKIESHELRLGSGEEWKKIRDGSEGVKILKPDSMEEMSLGQAC